MSFIDLQIDTATSTTTHTHLHTAASVCKHLLCVIRRTRALARSVLGV